MKFGYIDIIVVYDTYKNTVRVYEFMAKLSVWKYKGEYKNIKRNSQRVKSVLSCIHNNIHFCEKVLK